MHVAVRKLELQLEDELVDDAGDHRGRQVGEGHDRIQPVAELGREHLLDRVLLRILASDLAEADRLPSHVGGAGIGGHDQDGVAEIDRLAVMVGQLSVIHDLQKDVEQVRMCLLDLVEQEHAVRMLVDRVGQQAALVVSDIARRSADQAADRMALHIFGHVEPLQRNSHDRGELAGDLGLADARGAGEEVIADRLVGIAKTGAAELDC